MSDMPDEQQPTKLPNGEAEQNTEQSSAERKSQLQKYETILARGRGAKATFMDQGEALLQIRKNRLYKEKGYTSFETYCQTEWGFSRQRAHQLIVAFQENEETTIDENEREARKRRKKKKQENEGGENQEDEAGKPKPEPEQEDRLYRIERLSTELALHLHQLSEAEEVKTAYRKIDPVIEWIKKADKAYEPVF